MALERYLLDRLIQNYGKVTDRSSVLHTGMALVAKGYCNGQEALNPIRFI